MKTNPAKVSEEARNTCPLTGERLPTHWQVKALRDAFRFTGKPRGLTVSAHPTVPFLPMDQIPIGRVSITTYNNRPSIDRTSGTYVENGDLLLAKITPSFENGKQVILNWDRPYGYATTEVIPIQEIEGISDKHFLFHLLLHPQLRSELAGKMDGTTGRQRLSKETLGSRLIPLPPLPEQKKIAAILGLVQKAIEQQERLIEKTAELKKTLLHQLFTQGLRNEPLKETEIGPVPESWELMKFEDFVQLQRGFDLPKSDFHPGPYPVIGATKAIGYHDTFNVKGPCVTVVRSGSSAGKPMYIPSDFWAHNVLLFAKDLHGHLPRFVYFKIQELDLTKYKEGVAVPTLNRNSFRSIIVAIPKREEHGEFVRVLNAVENKEGFHQRKLTTLAGIFRTLLHQLMTAQIRVGGSIETKHKKAPVHI